MNERVGETGEHLVLSAMATSQASLLPLSINGSKSRKPNTGDSFFLYYYDFSGLFKSHRSGKNKLINPEHFPDNVFIRLDTKRK